MPDTSSGRTIKRITEPSQDWLLVRNPVPTDPESIKRGRTLYEDKGMCFMCHGPRGDGHGGARGQFNPPPNAFLDVEWADKTSDGEIMGFLIDGKFGTGMVSFVPDFISEEEGWDIINYLRTFRGKTTEAYEQQRRGDEKQKKKREKLLKRGIKKSKATQPEKESKDKTPDASEQPTEVTADESGTSEPTGSSGAKMSGTPENQSTEADVEPSAPSSQPTVEVTGE